jgi:N-acetylglucosaminyldiphosphoundecaprenol N-acetyl-beta-D-mannosaminyltransferase
VKWDSVEIAGLRIAIIDRDSLIQQAIEWGKGINKRKITYINANCITVASTNSQYRHCLDQIDLIYVDGIGLVWAARFLGKPTLYKVTGRIWIEELCRRAALEGVSLYLLGGRPGVAEKAANVLVESFPGLRICGTCDGYFSGKEEATLLAELIACKPQILLIGMGVPRQEFWVAEHHEQISATLCWSVGALFDYLAGVERPVPAWMERIGCEWLWRLYLDPPGKWRRYVLGIPRFCWLIVKEKYRKQG